MHIGNKIKNVFETRGIEVEQFAQRLGMQRANMYKIFERKTIQTGLLLKIGLALDFNFFALLKEEQSEMMGEEPEQIEISMKIPKKELKNLLENKDIFH